MPTFHQGKFKCKHPEKYKGNPTKIFYRSSWELKYMLKLDHDENVEWWQSEEIMIPYHDRSRGHGGHYYPDFLVKFKDKKRPVMYEIKPLAQTMPPKNNGNQKRFVKEALAFAKNVSKWEAAREWCKLRGYDFEVVTEIRLGIPGRG
jgi:TnsA endonuclease N terminal